MRIPALETNRLNVRPFMMDDLPATHAYTSDAAIMKYIPEGQMTRVQTEIFVRKQVGQEAKAFAVERKADGRLIGHLSFHPWFAHRTFEIGWVFHPAFHDKGYATEAAHRMMAYGFQELDLHRIIATCQPENAASFRVMEKLGMRREGHFRRCIYRGEDTWWDEYFYAILKTEWTGAG